MSGNPNNSLLDFENTAIAFEHRDSKELKKMSWLFELMNRPWIVKMGGSLTQLGLKLRLPIQGMIKYTIFEQFCGGETLKDCEKSVKHLDEFNVKTILDFGVEAKDNESDFDQTVVENIQALKFSAQSNGAIPIISVKVSGLCPFHILEKVSQGTTLLSSELEAWERGLARLDKICGQAATSKIGIFIDAEESWVQQAIDDATMMMMEKYNQTQVIVYNTFQMYRHDRLAFLKASHEIAINKGFLLGAKVVRGAYMEKERDRAAKMGYASPIQPNKAATDKDYDAAIVYCFEHKESIALCLASHNQKSTLMLTALIDEKGMSKNDPHLIFCQLYGMGDNLTFNLAKAGYQAGKYVPYGPVKEVIPYLLRRAQENSSVGNEVSRELSLIRKEIERRKKGQ